MYEEGVTEDELSGAKSYLTGNFAVRLSNIGAIAGALAEIAHYDLGMDYFERYQHIINGLTRKEVNTDYYIHLLYITKTRSKTNVEIT